MRRTVIFSLGLVAACASSGTKPSQSPDAQSVRISGTSGSATLRTTSTTMARVDTLWVGLDRVWKALPNVYTTLEIPIERFDAERNVIGHSGFKIYRRLGKTALTRYLDCGSTQLGQNAESYEIQLTVLTYVRPVESDKDKTSVATEVEASARPIQFRGDYVRCASKGTLEARFAELLKVELAP